MNWESCTPRLVTTLRMDGRPTQTEIDCANHLSPMMCLASLRVSAVRLVDVRNLIEEEKMEDEYIEEEDEQTDEQTEPEEGDYTTSDHCKWYQYGVLVLDLEPHWSVVPISWL